MAVRTGRTLEPEHNAAGVLAPAGRFGAVLGVAIAVRPQVEQSVVIANDVVWFAPACCVASVSNGALAVGLGAIIVARATGVTILLG